jgi:hypothetical protein
VDPVDVEIVGAQPPEAGLQREPELTWLGERLYYLAASGIPPFDNEATLIETMLTIWTSTLYGEIPGPPNDSVSKTVNWR